MANIKPTDLYAGYELLAQGGTATAQSIAIPLAALPGLSAAEANATTGDGRELLRIILKSAKAALDNMSPNARPLHLSLVTNIVVIGTDCRRVEYLATFVCNVDESSYALNAES